MAECVNHESNRSVASEAKAEKCGLIESSRGFHQCIFVFGVAAPGVPSGR